MGEAARQKLQERIEDAIKGAPVTLEELGYWLKLVRWAATKDVAAVALEAASQIESTDLPTPPVMPKQAQGDQG
jgi:hypothetical protein